MRCSLCGRESPTTVPGEPAVRGPVCLWCRDTAVRRASHASGAGQEGAWVVRIPSGLVVTADPWWLAHEIASASMPGASEEEVCRAAEEAPVSRADRGRDVELFGRRAEWLGRVMLHGPARLVKEA